VSQHRCPRAIVDHLVMIRKTEPPPSQFRERGRY
jgi:hypothetical protein